MSSFLLRQFLPLSLALSVSAGAATLPVKLDALTNAELYQVSAGQRTALSKNGFVISPAGWRQFSEVYDSASQRDQPVFVTTDAVLHTYHLVFDKALRDLEREALAPAVQRMLTLLVADAQKQQISLKGTPLEADARRALAYLVVARKLGEPAAPVPADVKDVVAAELKLIDAHGGFDPSPIFRDAAVPGASPLLEDYSQYVPRGHYTQSEALKRYFLSMMWLGRMNLRAANPAETRTAALLTQLLTRNAEAQALWARVYDPTRLLVGASDDLTFREYSAALQKVTGGDVQQLTSAAKLKAFQAALNAYPSPQISSMFVRDNENKDAAQRGLRLMGQRFTLDASAFQQLVYSKVGTQANPRVLPKGLDLLAALGNDTALNILKGMGEDKYLNYLTQMQKVRAKFSGLKGSDWNANVYSGWIYTLGALAKPEARDGRYPAFMRTPAWTRKELLTALGSWTELRHDTILYAKQTYTTYATSAQMPVQPKPKPQGYVEPNLGVWQRLLDLEARTRGVLKNQGVLSSNTSQSLGSLRDMLTLIKSASTRELAGQKLTDDEYLQLQHFGSWLSMMRARSSDPADPKEPGGNQDTQNHAGVVADVATDPNTGQVLEEGTGFIQDIYAVVPNGQGGQQIVHGGVYSQYEFTVPLTGRLTDEAWRKMLTGGKTPATHAWLNGVVVK